MGHLVDLQGNPLAWSELHARREAYYAAREETFAPVRDFCRWGGCTNVPSGRYCVKHRPQNRARGCARLMAALCQCGAKKNHAIHLLALGMQGAHKYADPTKAGISPIGRDREEYQKSEQHKTAYARAEEAPFCLAGMAECAPIFDRNDVSRGA